MDETGLPEYLMLKKNEIRKLYETIQQERAKGKTFEELTPQYEYAKDLQTKYYIDLLKYYKELD